MSRRFISVEVSDVVYRLLEVLAREEAFEPATVETVIARLIDHAQQGVYRPGSWERGWLEQVFGSSWQQYLEPGDPHGRPDDEISLRCFQRPRRLS